MKKVGVQKIARGTDPRIERSRHNIRQAALEELGSVGYGSFAIESVARRAGVGKSTIYRLWKSKLALVSDAFESLNTQGGHDLDGYPPRERVERIVRHLAEIVVDSTFSACIPALIEAAERDAELKKFHHKFAASRKKNLVRAIRDGIEQGEFPKDVDPELAASTLAGAIFYQRLMTGSPMPVSNVPVLITLVLGK